MLSDASAISDHAALYTIIPLVSPTATVLNSAPTASRSLPSLPRLLLTDASRLHLPNLPLPNLRHLLTSWTPSAPTNSPDTLLQLFETALH